MASIYNLCKTVNINRDKIDFAHTHYSQDIFSDICYKLSRY